jgi:hypothetical protein
MQEQKDTTSRHGTSPKLEEQFDQLQPEISSVTLEQQPHRRHCGSALLRFPLP